MKQQMAEVMLRRRELLTRIASQRMQVAEIGTRWQTPLGLADQVLAGMRFLRSHPVLVGGVVALLVIRRGGVYGTLLMCSRLWKGYRYLKTFSAKLPSLF